MHQVSISRVGTWLLAMICVVLATALFVAPGGVYIAKDPGAAADWVAAAGAWALGIAAAYYAREAHLQRTAEIARMERQSVVQREKTFDSMILRVHRAKLLQKLYSDIKAEEHASHLGAQDAIGILAILKGALGSLTWPPEDFRLLKGETQLTIVSIENSLSGIAQIIELARRAEDARDWTLYFERHESIRQLCGDISEYCDSAQTALVNERDADSSPN